MANGTAHSNRQRSSGSDLSPVVTPQTLVARVVGWLAPQRSLDEPVEPTPDGLKFGRRY